MVNKIKVYNIFLIEDNLGDVRFIWEVFWESKNDIKFDVVIDGIEVIKYFCKEFFYEDVFLFDFILLDLNLFKWDGWEVFGVIKFDEILKWIFVVVFMIFNVGVDILKSYDLYVNCFINKFIDFDKFFEIIYKIEDFWLFIMILLIKVF